MLKNNIFFLRVQLLKKMKFTHLCVKWVIFLHINIFYTVSKIETIETILHALFSISYLATWSLRR
jgi:hypothetical protein